MYGLLLKIILIGAFLQLGISMSDVMTCYSRKCTERIADHSKDILKIDWKPISVFPKEAKKFR